jgi:RimJ/RimL family protein N-acetyltransferase
MIEGKLVNLRAYEISDAEAWVRWYNDQEVIEHLSWRYPFSLAAEEAYLNQRTSTPLDYNTTLFAIETKDGVHIGGINFNVIYVESRKARLGITIGEKAHWSQGYGADAVRTIMRFGFDEMNLHRIDLTVDEDNARAIACYKKVGFIEEGRLRQARYTRGRHIDWLVMGILREEFYKPDAAAPPA